jgi:hypothetical protein
MVADWALRRQGGGYFCRHTATQMVLFRHAHTKRRAAFNPVPPSD